MRIYLLTFAVGIEFILTACSTPKAPPQDWISQQWARSMATYNILPVYPPTEDVYVGDIYAYGTDLTGVEGNLFSSVKIDSVSVEAELEQMYSLHPVFPDTPAKPPKTDDIWAQPGTGDKTASEVVAPSPPKVVEGRDAAKKQRKTPAGAKNEVVNKPERPEHPGQAPKPAVNIFANTTTRTKLALIVFPAFTLANADAESLGISVPLKFFQALFGTSRKHADSITIKITAAETYGLPARVAREKFEAWCNGPTTQFSCKAGNARAELQSLRSVSPTTPVGIAFINRVYLARSIEYTYDASTAVGASGDLTVTLQKALENQKTLQSALSEKPASGAAGASAPTADQVATLKDVRTSLDELLAQLQKVNQQSIGSSAPGASFSVGSVSSQGVSLIQTFERPVAIGYRAVTLTPQ